MKKNKLLVLASILFLSLSACGEKQGADAEMVEPVETDNVLRLTYTGRIRRSRRADHYRTRGCRRTGIGKSVESG